MKTPENNSNKKPRKKKIISQAPVSVPTETPSVVPQPPPPPPPPQHPPLMEGIPLLEIDEAMMKEIIEKSKNLKTQRVKRYINDQKDAENIRSIIQEYFTSFILVGYSVDNKRLIVKSTNSDKDEDALLEELRYVCFKLSSGG